jgi:hypothetical protein
MLLGASGQQLGEQRERFHIGFGIRIVERRGRLRIGIGVKLCRRERG